MRSGSGSWHLRGKRRSGAVANGVVHPPRAFAAATLAWRKIAAVLAAADAHSGCPTPSRWHVQVVDGGDVDDRSSRQHLPLDQGAGHLSVAGAKASGGHSRQRRYLWSLVVTGGADLSVWSTTQ
jgi:hypothetical protein